jgi:hypothetical protein
MSAWANLYNLASSSINGLPFGLAAFLLLPQVCHDEFNDTCANVPF